MKLYQLQALIVAAFALLCLGAALLPKAAQRPAEGVHTVCAAVGYDPNDLNRALCQEFSAR